MRSAVIFGLIFLLLEGISHPIPVRPKHFQGLVENPMSIVQPLNLLRPIISPNLVYRGGPIMQHSSVVIVLWGSGTYLPEIIGPQLPQWFQDILGSPLFDFLGEYYQNVTGQSIYVGNGVYLERVMITPSLLNSGPLVSDDQIRTELRNQINAGVLQLTTANNVFMVYFPQGITVYNLGTSCLTFCGYHGSFNFVPQATGVSTNIRYGVVPDLTPLTCQLGCGVGASWQQTCQVSSHELAEITTDPRVLEGKAAWYDLVNGEVADICLGYTGTITVGQNTWNVQKLWSQSEGNCIVSKDFSIGYALTNGQIVRGGAGGSATITLAQLGGSTQAVSFSVSTLPTGVQVNWSSSSFNSGTTQLTVTATSSASRGSLSLTVVAQGSLYQKTLNVGGFTIV